MVNKMKKQNGRKRIQPVITVRLEGWGLKLLQFTAKEQNITVPQVIRQAINDYLTSEGYYTQLLDTVPETLIVTQIDISRMRKYIGESVP